MLHNVARITLVPLALVLVLVGCNRVDEKKPGPPAGEKPLDRPANDGPGKMYLDRIPALPVKVVIDDKAIATFDRFRNPDLNSYQQVDLEKMPRIEAIKVAVLTPDGWREDLAKVTDYGPQDCKFEFVQFETISIFIDNRGPKAAEIKCGQLTLQAAAGSSGGVRCPPPAKPASAQIQIDGKEVGTLWPEQTKAPNRIASAWLIDTSGKRAYLWREVFYGATGGILSKFEVGPEPRKGELRSKYLHSLPVYPDFFLCGAPDAIEAAGGLVRVELQEATAP